MSHGSEIASIQSSLPDPAPAVISTRFETSSLVPVMAGAAARLHIRRGTAKDLAFMDQMQKLHGGKLGFMYAKALQKALDDRRVILAVDNTDVPFGFLMWGNPYSGREDLTICFQLAVVPAFHRKLIGATLVKEWFTFLPIGVKLACLWCAQDLPANRFWEACGFQAIAWRTGSRAHQRPHIFWTRRTNAQDTTPLWYPHKTARGAVNEERLILPILPGQHWSDALPTLLPGQESEKMLSNGLAAETGDRQRQLQAIIAGAPKAIPVAGNHPKVPEARGVMTPQGIRFIGGSKALDKAIKMARKPPKRKADPTQVHAARDVHDRFLHDLNSGHLALPTNERYNVSRMITGATDGPLLTAAALQNLLPQSTVAPGDDQVGPQLKTALIQDQANVDSQHQANRTQLTPGGIRGTARTNRQ